MSVIDLISKRRSVRNFKKEDVDIELIKRLMQNVLRSPSSKNTQTVSMILVENKIQKQKMGEIIEQKHIIESSLFIVFLIDFTKIAISCNNASVEFDNSIKLSTLITSVLDVGIMLGMFSLMLEDNNIQSCMHGTVREKPDFFIKELNLPKYTYPICGLSIGYGTDDAMSRRQVPRLPKDSVIFENFFKEDSLSTLIKQFDEFVLTQYSNGKTTWSNRMATIHDGSNITKNETEILIKQGLLKRI